MEFFSDINLPIGLHLSFYNKSQKIFWSEGLEQLEQIYKNICSTWHQSKQDEFLMGRHLVHSSFRNNNLEWEKPVLMGEKREPLFPYGISASLSHNQEFIVFAFQKGNSLVGIDVESRGRVKVKLEGEILRNEDTFLFDQFDGELSKSDYITLVFSAKESCYKALFPFYKEYFGFKDAYLKEIDSDEGTFKIVVTKKFQSSKSHRMGPLILDGGFKVGSSFIFTYISSNL